MTTTEQQRQALQTRLETIPTGRTEVVLGRIVTCLAADEYQIGKYRVTLKGAVEIFFDLYQAETGANLTA